MTPYLLDTPAVVSFSGGLSSGYMLWETIQAFGGTLPAGVKVAYANTGKERVETLDFVERCSQEWGVEIVWLEYHADGFRVTNYATASRKGEPFEALIAKRNFLPNPVSRFCTTELKLRPMRDWCKSLGWETWNVAVGIRADEPRRLARGKANAVKERYEVVHPLGDAGVTLGDVATFWKSQPFTLQLQPHEGNCDLCFLKGAGRIQRILADRPDLAAWWIEQEERIVRRAGGTGRFRRDRPGYRAQLEMVNRPGLFDGFTDADELSVNCHCTD